MSEAVELGDVITFLMGEGPLDGYWFGDTVPVSQDKPYWWRDALRKAWNRRAKPEGEPDWAVSKDGPHEIGRHRRWLARKLMDSMLSDEEAFSIVYYHPNISDLWKAKANPPEGEPVAWVCEGCGHPCRDPVADLAGIRAAGKVSCCPERKMQTAYTRPVAWPDREAVARAIADGFSHGCEPYAEAPETLRFRYDMAADAILPRTRVAMPIFTGPGSDWKT